MHCQQIQLCPHVADSQSSNDRFMQIDVHDCMHVCMPIYVTATYELNAMVRRVLYSICNHLHVTGVAVFDSHVEVC